MDELDERRRRAAENQTLFREVNERIGDLNRTFDALAPYGSWTCECASIGCIERIQMTLGEYEALRAEPACFAVAPSADHVVPDVEVVRERTERYWVVEKLGAAAERAAELDPRTA
jgi:hypothetical protein